ncbi:MAG: LCP family protein [Cyanobacteriota bacterium]|nr:LCP family protein [Cyanobacteriota bacterium]
MTQRTKATASAPKGRSPLPVLLAVALGLGGGLVLSAPLADLISGRGFLRAGASTNPFEGWNALTQKDVLILGTDVGGGNTDVIATVRSEGGVTRVTQIPRDTYIEADQFGPLKINALYTVGGSDALKRELAARLGRPIDHHVVVNLAAIRTLGDMLGGIEVDVPKRMVYVDNSQGLRIDLQPGRQVLRGHDLEGFLRFRHDEMGDIGRLERQQLALQGLFRRLSSPQNLVRLPALLVAAGRNIQTDLGPMELGGLVTSLSHTTLETSHLGGRPFMRDGISYWEAEWPGDRFQGIETSSSPQRRLPFLF